MGRWLDGRQRALIAWLVHAVLVDQMGSGWDSAVGWRGLTPGDGAYLWADCSLAPDRLWERSAGRREGNEARPLYG